MKENKIRLATLSLFAVGMAIPFTAVQAAGYSVKTSALYTKENGVEGTVLVDFIENSNGPTLGLLHVDANNDGVNDNLLEVIDNGNKYAFKDMNKNKQLDPFEDWRLDAETRAASLANELAFNDKDGIKKIAGLMLFSLHEFSSAPGLTDEQKKYLDNSYVRNITDAAGNNVADAVGWSNAMQSYVEKSGFNIPVDFSSDPRSTAGTGDMYSDLVNSGGGSRLSGWPSNIGLAATFSTQHMYNFAKATSAEYRALGIVTALGPQIDLATEPRWLRVGGTFGENVRLATDMAQAYVDGSQSTYSASGEDLGWGRDSINAMIKHFPGDGSGESGRESHSRAGKFAVYPGNNAAEHLIPFTDGGLNLSGKTQSAAAVMTSYSIAIGADGKPVNGKALGSAYASDKMDLLRHHLHYDGVVCTDWGVTKTPPPDNEKLSLANFGMSWGMEQATEAQRHYAILKAGSDMFGGNNDAQPVVDAFAMMVEEHGEQYARERFASSARRLIKLTMQPGLFENPYLQLENSLAIAGSEEKIAMGYRAQLDSVVMLKNDKNVIKAASPNGKQAKDMTVYIPQTYTEAISTPFINSPAQWTPSMNLEVAKKIYGTVLTDTINEQGQVIAPDLRQVDKVIIGMRSPMNGDTFTESGRVYEKGEESFYPLSLQYAPYTANGKHVRKTSLSGNTLADGSQQNRSYFGKTAKISNGYDLTATLNAVQGVRKINREIPVIVALNASSAVIVSEFEPLVDGIIVGFSVSENAIFDVIEGKHEPKGLLPLQFPANMDTVEANYEDVAGDVDCYRDNQGYTWDVAYGLNWSGVIADERVKKYAKNSRG